MPVKRFVVATNENDTVPRYLATGQWSPNHTVATISNAMDVSKPNNWPRIEELFKVKGWSLKDLAFGKCSEVETVGAMQELYKLGYTSEPHGAVAYKVLQDVLQEGEVGVFLETAHPAKFIDSVEEILDIMVAIPDNLARYKDLPLLSLNFPADYEQLRQYLVTTKAVK